MACLEWREKVCESGIVGIWSGSIVRDSQFYDGMEGRAWREGSEWLSPQQVIFYEEEAILLKRHDPPVNSQGKQLS